MPVLIKRCIKAVLVPCGLYHVLKYIQRRKDNSSPTVLYPMKLPDITVKPDLDLLLLELPPRYMPMMPNGLGYLHNLLESLCIKQQTLDLSIIMYHRYHQSRLHEGTLHQRPSGGDMPEDPWENTMLAEWHGQDFLEFFRPDLEKALDRIERAKPRMVGVSLNGFNRQVARFFLGEIRKRLPEAVVLVGGYDCVYPNVGPRLFSDFDYMVVGEAEHSLPGLLKGLLAGERPRDIPGVLSKYDNPGRAFTPAPLVENLDDFDFPRYPWLPHTSYQTFDRKHMVPITASRGCNWGRCNFCAERFSFRKRSPEKVADEMGYWNSLGFHTFHFNESDVNGDPDNLYAICSQIIERGLEARMVGQLRVDRRNTEEYFMHLAKAGFTHLRFGVDGWSNHTLQLQNKGYPIHMVHSNIKACHASGIFTTVNVVIGVPGETDEDIEESILNIKELREEIDCVESINTLILAQGSRYLDDPDKYNIKLHGLKDEITTKNPYYIPTDLWYSEKPYIDQEVRMQRMERIISELDACGVNIGSFAKGRIDDLKKGDQAWQPQTDS